MNHLSEQELLECMDGQPDAAQGTVANHIAECDRCRAMIILQRQIRNSGARVEKGLLSANFTNRIMLDIHSPQPAPRFSWLLENSANVFAMIFVIGVVGCIIFIAAQTSPGSGDSAFSRQMTLWHDAYAYIMNAILARNRETLLPVVSEAQGIFGNVFLMGGAALLLLGFLDKLSVFSKIFKTR